MKHWLLASSLLAACGFAAAQSSAGGMAVREVNLQLHPVRSVPSSCFWIGALTRTEPALNILFPDAEATYWVSQFRIPAGATLRLASDFPFARYASYNAYDSGGATKDSVHDAQLRPEPGSGNPFMAGADRAMPGRRYVVEIVDAPPPREPSFRAPNTVYARSDESVIQLYYRVYIPDQGKDVTGGVGLPQPSLVWPDGREVSGDALCRQVVIPKGALRDRAMPKERFQKLLQREGMPAAFPALESARWEVILNPPLTLSRLTHAGTPEGDAQRMKMDMTRRGGAYPAMDNRYMLLYVDRRLGPVLTLRGTLPTTPATRAGARAMPATQLRYWSLCFNRSLADTSVDDCVADEDVVLIGQRRYTIVVSREEDRPAQRTPRMRCHMAALGGRRRRGEQSGRRVPHGAQHASGPRLQPVDLRDHSIGR
ncbi:hypothetical protein LP417_06195 [Polaromonas sp. P1-6]|nr:hypothetical protein LP417_06195 [Polaromonas sp. P1-6]